MFFFLLRGALDSDRVYRRGWVLTQFEAPQDGLTPRCIALIKQHDSVFQLLLKASVDQPLKREVNEGEWVGRLGGRQMLLV